MFKRWHFWVLFVGIFLVSFSYGLDAATHYTFQNYAVAAFQKSGQISTIGVVRGIVAAASQPAFAKLSDYFGRISVLVFSVLFWGIGNAIQATAKSVGAFSAGAVLYQFAFTGIIIICMILIADTTTLRARVLASWLPATPFLVTTWVGGNVAQSVMDGPGWRWGIGIFAIVVPAATIPLFASLTTAEVRAKRAGLLDNIVSPYRQVLSSEMWIDCFWACDILGLVLLAFVLGLILVPFTLAGGSAEVWRRASTIVPLVLGVVVALPAFIYWEAKGARHPLVPFRVLASRQVLSCIVIAILINTTWYTQGDYIYQTLLVSFGKDITTATRVMSIDSFVSVIIGVVHGFIVRRVRRLKWWVVAGAGFIVLAFVLLVRFRGGFESSDFIGFIAGEVMLGIGKGFLPYSTQCLIQAAVGHERTAVITGIYLASYSIGTALGNTIAGAIWINTMPGHMEKNLINYGVSNSTAIAGAAFADPFTWIATNPVGTPAREAINLSYRQVQRYLCGTGLGFSVLMLLITLLLANPYLTDTQSLGVEETDAEMVRREKEERGVDKA
ncbi:hypothetical protein VHUM_03891 [Vanrija humicola]|uniref:Major facilitator superfamily (MFS) profile domain-containing protein n=1 Tax=Vanrija humicola TaxID=5417 RepID=A0A7D8V2X5_VANHU|nr:hypothetical protein VHUM_03891 [Vanrija humicola]